MDVLNEKAIPFLYGDVEPQLMQYLCFSSAVKHSVASYKSIIQHSAADVKASKTYIACEKDRIVPFERQLGLATAAGATIARIPFGHCPFAMKEGVDALMGVVSEVISS